MRRNYKYCPNCSYRLRPEIVPTTTTPAAPVTVSARLVALGGYLAFASMLLLVVFAGFRLFARPEIDPGSEPRMILTRDADRLPLGRASFIPVEAGETFYGPYLEDEAEPVVPTRFLVDDAFELGISEITNDQYYAFLLARAAQSGEPVDRLLFPEAWSRRSGNPDVRLIYDRGDGNLPVMGVHYQFALEFCAWYWEERLNADPDVIVDLPRQLEYVRAARGDRFEDNFPWGATIDRREIVARLDGDPLPVNSLKVGRTLDGRLLAADSPERGFHALVGNAAEWVHGQDAAEHLAAGWSHLNAEYYAPQGRRFYTPFGDDGFQLVPQGKRRRDLGFRILLRRAPHLPAFVKVKAGAARHVPLPAGSLRPPLRTDEEGNLIRAETIRFDGLAVSRPFEMARTEITNRQYLHFLTSVMDSKGADHMKRLIPSSWERPNPWNWRRPDPEQGFPGWEDTVYLGPWGNPWKIQHVYEAGSDNRPVQGVTLQQVEAYAAWVSTQFAKACRIPTVAEFLRAGRRARADPYPWGDDAHNPLLICLGGIDDEGRTVSLLGRFGPGAPPLLGLAGNLPEYVRDPQGGRVLLAGGCYLFPSELCTLDSFMDAAWDYVEFDVQGGEDEETDVLKPLSFYAGFRLVRVLGPF